MRLKIFVLKKHGQSLENSTKIDIVENEENFEWEDDLRLKFAIENIKYWKKGQGGTCIRIITVISIMIISPIKILKKMEKDGI